MKEYGFGIRIAALALSLALAFGPAGALAAADAQEADGAYKDTLDQQAAAEAAKELFTLTQIRDMARSVGGETKKAQSDLALAQAGKETAEMGLYDAQYAMQSAGDAIRDANQMIEDAGNALALVLMDPSASEEDLEAAAVEFAVKKATADALIAAASQTATQIEAAMSGARNGLDKASTGFDDAKAALQSQMETAVYNGEELFFSYLQLLDSLAMMEKTIEFNKNQLRIEELKARIGLSTGVEVLKKELILADLEEKKQLLINGVDMAGRSLMRQIGKDGDTAFRLDPAYSIEGLKEEYDPDQLAELAVRNSLYIGVLNRTIDKLANTIEDNKGSASRAMTGAERDGYILQRDNLIQSMKQLGRLTAKGLETARADIALLEKKLAEKRLAYDVMDLQVQLGLAPRIGLSGLELDLLATENDLAKARQSYYLSLRKASLLVQGIAVY